MPRNKPRYKKRSVKKGHLVRVKIKPKTPTAVSKFEKEEPIYAQNIDENTANLSDITMRSSLLNDMCGGGLFNTGGKCVNKKLQREARKQQKKSLKLAKKRIKSGG